MWTPKINQMVTPIKLKDRVATIVNGQSEISYTDKQNPRAFCNWKSKGGSETTQSGSIVVEDTAEVIMWYRPDINERDLILLNGDIPYEIVNVENVEMRNLYLIIKVRRALNG